MDKRADWYAYEVASAIREQHSWIWAIEPRDRPVALVRWWLRRKARRIWVQRCGGVRSGTGP